jgi:hypothetical protein
MIKGYSKTRVKLTNGQEMPLSQLLGPLPEELKPLAEELKPRFAKLTRENAQGHHEIGHILRQEIGRIEAESRAQGRSTYGLKVFDRLGIEMDIRPRILRDCVQAADAFSPQEFQSQIVDRGLTWSHARLLAVVADAKTRQSLVEKTVVDGLSADELGHLIVNDKPKKPRGPGRGVATPRNLREAIDRLRSGSKAFRNILDVLFGEAFDLPTAIQNLPPDAFTQQCRAAVAECADHLAALEQIVQTAGQRLKAKLEHIDICIAAQTEQTKTNPTEEKETNNRNKVCGVPTSAC